MTKPVAFAVNLPPGFDMGAAVPGMFQAGAIVTRDDGTRALTFPPPFDSLVIVDGEWLSWGRAIQLRRAIDALA